MYRPYSNSQADFRPFRDVESQLRDLTQDFATSFNTGNYDQAASLFASDGCAHGAHCMRARTGRSQSSSCCGRWVRRDTAICALETTRVDHSGDMAMELGRFSVCSTEGRWNGSWCSGAST